MNLKNIQPNKQQELLLKACLLDEAHALEAFGAWRRNVDLESLQWPSRNCLPLLYSNLKNHLAPKDKLIIEKIYDGAQERNELLIADLQMVLEAFKREGIKVILLKGMALLHEYYKDRGLRLMADIDMLVEETMMLKTIKILKKLNWTLEEPLPIKRYRIQYQHAINCLKANKRDIDIHWKALQVSKQSGIDDGFWQRAIASTYEGFEVYLLSPADQLLSICAHGARPGNFALRWIPDAMTVLNSEKEINWEDLLSECKSRHLRLYIAEMLGYLKNEFNAKVPIEIVNEMQKPEHSDLERLHFDITVGKYAKNRTYWGIVNSLKARYQYNLSTRKHVAEMKNMNFSQRFSDFIWWVFRDKERDILRAFSRVVRNPMRLFSDKESGFYKTQ